MSEAAIDSGSEILGARKGRAAEVLTSEAIDFIADLHRRFDPRRRELLAKRVERQKRFDAGEASDFLESTRAVREGDWRIAPVPRDLQDRRVEITGPVDRKMIINALNSGAKVFMADFEDATSPTVPFISAIVDLDGGGVVKGNLIDFPPSPEAIKFDMPVRLVFKDAGRKDKDGASYLSYFFVPA